MTAASSSAETTTDADGAFSFTGVPPGKLRLYYSSGKRRGWLTSWVPVRMLDINTAAHNFGRIDVRVKTVTVQLAGRPADDARLDLYYYDPSPFLVHFAADPTVPEPRTPRLSSRTSCRDNTTSPSL